ncbi:MAG: hypothetical protein ACYS8K_11005, partial [Planctomycetota bacterium]
GLSLRCLRQRPHMARPPGHVLAHWWKALAFKWPTLRPRHLLRTLATQGGLPQREDGPPWLSGLRDHIFAIATRPRAAAGMATRRPPGPACRERDGSEPLAAAFGPA